MIPPISSCAVIVIYELDELWPRPPACLFAFSLHAFLRLQRVRSRQQRSRRRQQLRERVGSGMNALLLFTAAVDRLATRLRTAVGATAKVAWQLGAEGLSGASSASRQAQAKVQEGFYKRCGAVRCGGN